MKVPSYFILNIYLPFCVRALNFGNNACPKLLLYPISSFESSKCYVNPDVSSDVSSMVKRHGFKLETHSVITDDGYILTLFAISGQVTKNVTVFLQHGAISSCEVWLGTGNRSLVFYLAKKGYKVWLGNTRGTTYSKKHINLTGHDSKYWEYNLDTITERDMLTQLNFVAERCEQKIHYIGHSMGSTLGLMFASTFSEKSNNWLQSLSLLAPMVYVHDTPQGRGLQTSNLLSFLGVKIIFYHETFVRKFLNVFCKLLPEACYEFLAFSFGPTTNFPFEDLLLFFSHGASSTSVYQMVQFAQIAQSAKFQKFDYGRAKNLKKYGIKESPIYKLNNVKIPIIVFYGENDSSYSKENMDRLYDEIGSGQKYKLSISCEGNSHYNHLDFIYSKCLVEDFYPILESFLELHEDSSNNN